MRISKKERQVILKETIEENPFITDEELSDLLSVSVQTIRLDRMELAIPELRERIRNVAEKHVAEEVKSLPIDEVIGEIIDIQLDKTAISIFDVEPQHVFKRNLIARGHHLFAQANSLAVAVINDELALTVKVHIHFTRPVKSGERVVAKANVRESSPNQRRTIVDVNSYVGNELVFKGEFEMYRSSQNTKDEKNENSY